MCAVFTKPAFQGLVEKSPAPLMTVVFFSGGVSGPHVPAGFVVEVSTVPKHTNVPFQVQYADGDCASLDPG